MELPEKMTIGEAYEPAMKMTDEAAAREYFAALVDRHMRYFGKSRAEAEQNERTNLGYFAGYYDNETRARVERLFSCSHPVFGSIAKVGAPTPDEALQAGRDLAARRTV